MQKHKNKTPLIISFCLLGGALFLLSGCTWENKPAAKEKPVTTLPLDKLKAETPPTEAPTSKKDPLSKPPQKLMNQKSYSTPPVMSIDLTKTYTATLDTDKGKIEITLNAKVTPVTVNNFVFLAREKFYDTTIFHRIIPGFMIQGGDPQGNGTGGPGYRFDDEAFTGEYQRGVVAMANAGPDTNGSQFFIMHADYNLPKNYVIFGEVTSGLDVVDAIATAPTVPGGENSKPVTPVKVKTVTIEEL